MFYVYASCLYTLTCMLYIYSHTCMLYMTCIPTYAHTHVSLILCVLHALILLYTGQELGGEMLFGRRIGFSGTPSDILPRELGQCDYERGSDGQVVHYLTSPAVVSHVDLPVGWTVKALLDRIAQVCILYIYMYTLYLKIIVRLTVRPSDSLYML